MTTRAALVSRVSRLRRSTLARAFTSLTKSEEKDRLLAVLHLRPIESVRGGHVGGGGVNNKNIFAWELNFFPKEKNVIVLLLQHGRRAHTL